MCRLWRTAQCSRAYEISSIMRWNSVEEYAPLKQGYSAILAHLPMLGVCSRPYLTVSEIVTSCCSAPEAAVTVTVEVVAEVGPAKLPLTTAPQPKRSPRLAKATTANNH